jgi:hypothetical protein
MYIYVYIDLKNDMGPTTFIELITFVIWKKEGLKVSCSQRWCSYIEEGI